MLTPTQITTLIERAVALAQEHTKHFPLVPGTTAIHPSEPVVANFDGYDDEAAVLSWADGRTARFPRHEVCDPNLVHAYAGRLKFNLAVDPTVRVEDHADSDHGVFVLQTAD